MKRNAPAVLRYVAKNLAVVVSIVLIWRGIWYVLDMVDENVFDGSHVVTAVGGIILGLVLLYVPDKDLKEIQKI